MGSACWYNGLPVLAANLSVRYRRSVPLAGHYLCEAKIDRLETRRAMVTARIYKDSTVYCEATGVFVRVPIELLKQQPDMARMVEIVESIKSGRSIHELIELDRARRRVGRQQRRTRRMMTRGVNWLSEGRGWRETFLLRQPAHFRICLNEHLGNCSRPIPERGLISQAQRLFLDVTRFDATLKAETRTSEPSFISASEAAKRGS
jgi:hypothetical protein